MTDENYMKMALIEAQEAYRKGEIPVGAVVVWNGRIIARAHNLTETLHDVTAHAEMQAITAAANIMGGKYLKDCTLYVTLEPCTMCAAAISFARLRRVYYGAEDPKGGAVDNGVRFFAQPTCHHAPDVYSGFHASAAADLLIDFFKSKRDA